MKKVIALQNIKNINFISSEMKPFIWEKEVESETEFLKMLSKEKAQFGMYMSKKMEVTFVRKELGSWIITNSFDIDLLAMNHFNIKPAAFNRFSKKIPFGIESEEIFFTKDGIAYHDNIINKIIDYKINLFLDNDYGSKIKKFKEKYGNFNFSSKRATFFSSENIDFFLKSASGVKPLKGLKIAKNIVKEDGYTTFTMGGAIISISKVSSKNNTETYDLFSLIKSKDEISNHYFNRNILTNISNHINNITITPTNKLKKSDIFFSLVGLTIFIILSIFTFTFIISPTAVSDSFDILFSQKTYTYPWIYLLWFNFFVSFLSSFIIMYIFSYLTFKRKPNLQNVINFFLAAQIRAAAVILTGQEALAMFLWGFYLVKKSGVRTSNLVGAVSVIQILRGILTIFIGFPFMIVGQTYVSSIINVVSGKSVNYIIFYILAWGGMLWFLLDKLIRGAIVFIPPSHFIYNKIYTFATLRNRNGNIFLSLQHREFGLRNLKSSVSGVFKNKKRTTRVGFTIFVLIILEALEVMYIFNIVEISMSSDIRHYNFIQISGARYMITQINHFPIINVMPGNGIAIIDIFMKNIYESIYLYTHSVDTTIPDLNQASEFSQQTTFITRFFNSYFKGILHLLISIYITIKIILRKK